MPIIMQNRFKRERNAPNLGFFCFVLFFLFQVSRELPGEDMRKEKITACQRQ